MHKPIYQQTTSWLIVFILLAIGVLIYWVTSGPTKTLIVEMVPGWDKKFQIEQVLYGVRYVWDGQPNVVYYWKVFYEDGQLKVQQFFKVADNGEFIFPSANFSRQWIDAKGFTKDNFAPELTRDEKVLQSLGFTPLFLKEAAAFNEIFNNLSKATQTSTQGGSLSIEGKHAKAQVLFRQALATNEQAFGADHPTVAVDLHNLGMCFALQGNYVEAEPLHRRALTIWEKVLGPEHQDVADSLETLAIFYEIQHKYNQAEPFYKRALTIREKALELDAPEVATNLEHYSVQLQKMNRKAEAIKMEARAKTIRAKQPPED